MCSKLKCAIIDDEPLASDLLESYVRKTPFLELTGKFHSAVEATQAVRETPPDVIFLDIQLAEMNGMEFASIVPPQSRIIFTTAFQQYALESYKVNALDYLLKPFGYTDFLQAANKALQWFEMNRKANMQSAPQTVKNGNIFVKTDYTLMQIETDSILYIEGLKDYVKIYVENMDKPVVSHITMKTLEDGTAQTNLEKYLADHFPGRDGLVGINAYWKLLTGRNAVEKIYYAKDGYLINAPTALDLELFTTTMERFDSFAKSTGLPASLLMVPSTGLRTAWKATFST